MPTFLYRPVVNNIGVELLDSDARGVFTPIRPQLPDGSSGSIRMAIIFAAHGTDRVIMQGGAGGQNDQRNSLTFTSDLQSATIWGDTIASFQTMDISSFGLVVGERFLLEADVDRDNGAGGILITLRNVLTGAQVTAGGRVPQTGNIRTIGSANSYTATSLYGTVYRVEFSYPNAANQYPINEGSGDKSYAAGDESTFIEWRNFNWVQSRQKNRSKLAGNMATGQAKRGTVIADRIA